MFVQGSSVKAFLVDESKSSCNSNDREFNSGEDEIERNVDSSQLESFTVTCSTSQQGKSSTSSPVQFKGKPNHVNASPATQSCSRHEMGTKKLDSSEGSLNSKPFRRKKKRIDLGLEQRIGNVEPSQLESSLVSKFTSQQDELSKLSPYNPFGLQREHKLCNVKTSPCSQSYSKHEMRYKKLDSTVDSPDVGQFDICLSRSGNDHAQTASLHKEDKENHNEEDKIEEGVRQQVLGPGMVLLKRYLTVSEQIEIVKTCQELGKGPGGFYQPGYENGAKLRLQMMCLGLDWDPQTRKYGKRRCVDGFEPPCIPEAFSHFVRRAMFDAHALIKREFRVSNVEHILPSMDPNICIVNFYTTSGRLGLHQDRDESHDSLQKGLPVVSFSVGDSAEFLYGVERDIYKSEQVVLESGDVLIFGGESRHIFHGVSSIIPNSAPGTLLEQAKLRPGRLNLTFRQF